MVFVWLLVFFPPLKCLFPFFHSLPCPQWHWSSIKVSKEVCKVGKMAQVIGALAALNRGSSFLSQHPLQVAQLTLTPVPEDLTLLLTFVGTWTHVMHMNSYRHIHINEIKSFLTSVLMPLKEICCGCLEDDSKKSGWTSVPCVCFLVTVQP